MGRELQKRKKRSSVPKIKSKPKSKRLNKPRGNAIIAANWNHKETLSQNYRRLGLTSRLNTATGGIEKFPNSATDLPAASTSAKKDKLSIANTVLKTLDPQEVKVERDPSTGKIIKVLYDEAGKKGRRRNPLGDPLNDLESGEEEVDDGDVFEGLDDTREEHQTQVVKELEQQALREAPKKERTQSDREREWIERLVGRWGDDYGKMAKDRKLNPMQQTQRDIQRRVGLWKERGGSTNPRGL